MMLPRIRRADARIGTDPVAADFSGSGSGSGSITNSPDTNMLIIVLTIVGIILVISLAFVAHYIRARRKRKINQHEDYETACLRNPNLTWEEYSRRTRLTQSRILLEEELQRDIMIRKSLQSRVDVSVTPVSPPARTRSRTWHGRNSSRGSTDTDDEEGEGLLMSLRGDWTEHEARVERTWQILHKKYPTRRVTLPVEEDGGPIRPPTIRLKTPPLLSHPMFRGWNGEGEMKHSSLPTELTKIKPAQI